MVVFSDPLGEKSVPYLFLQHYRGQICIVSINPIDWFKPGWKVLKLLQKTWQTYSFLKDLKGQQLWNHIEYRDVPDCYVVVDPNFNEKYEFDFAYPDEGFGLCVYAVNILYWHRWEWVWGPPTPPDPCCK